ncbi:MAG: DMT family transporter [Planctomycetota bacterium]
MSNSSTRSEENPEAHSTTAVGPSQSGSAKRLWVAELALLLVAVVWGINVPVMKSALQLGIDPYALNAIRLVISMLVLQFAASIEFRCGVRPDKSIRWSRILMYAMVVSVGYQILFLLAVSKTSSADVALIMATVPMWTALMARVFLSERLRPLSWLGLFIALAGTIIVAGGKAAPTSRPDELPHRFAGNVIALIAALTWAGGTVFSRPVLKMISPTQLAAVSTTIGLPCHLLIAGTATVSALPLLEQVPLQICLIYSGILSTGLALPMWSYGVKHAGAAQATMYQNLSPIVAIAAAWLWRAEPVSVEQFAGGTLILLGLLVMRHSRIRELAEVAK